MAELEINNPSTAPQPNRPLSMVVRWGHLVFASGQVPRRANGEEETGGIEAQTKVVMENLEAVLHAAGSSLANTVKTTVFLTDMADINGMDKVYADALGDHRPARSAVQIAALGKPAFRVEIEAIAVVDE